MEYKYIILDFSEIEADIDQYGINVLLQRLPNDQRMFPAIAKKRKSEEILIFTIYIDDYAI